MKEIRTAELQHEPEPPPPKPPQFKVMFHTDASIVVDADDFAVSGPDTVVLYRDNKVCGYYSDVKRVVKV